MEILSQAFKILGYLAGIILFLLFIISAIYAPIKKRKVDKEIEKITNELMNELAAKVAEEKPKKRGRKPKTTEKK